jgi:hypothetical protein
MFNELLILSASVKMAEQLQSLSIIVVFLRMMESKPDATVVDLDAENLRLYEEMVTRLEAIPKAPGSTKVAFKAALQYFADQL